MANKFQVEISAVDKFSKIFDRMGDKAKKAIRPLQDIGASGSSGGRGAGGGIMSGKGVQAFAQSMSQLGKVTEQATGKLGGLALPFSAISIGPGSAVAAAAAVAIFSSKYADLSTSVLRTSRVIGMSTDDLQAWTGAARAAGYNADSMTNSLHDLGSVAHQVRYGANDEARATMDKLKVRPKVGADGNIDVNNLMEQVTRALNGIANPFTKAHAARILGIDSNTMQYLGTGNAAVLEGRQKMVGTNAVQTRAQLEQAEIQRVSKGGLGNTTAGIANRIGDAVSPGMTTTMNILQGKREFTPEAVGPERWSPDDPGTNARKVRRSVGSYGNYNSQSVRQQIAHDAEAGAQFSSPELRQRLLGGEKSTVEVHVKVEGGAAKVTATSSNPASAPVRVSNALSGTGP